MMNKITRRTALTTGLAAGAASCASGPVMTPYSAISEGANGIFAHGVASGDPGLDSGVIWTRITSADMRPMLTIIWETAADEAFTDMRGKGEATTTSAVDWTVKVLLKDLEPGQIYYYRFRLGDSYSAIGRTRTLPAGAVDRARFAVVSCSSFPHGYFNVYDLIARRNDFDAVIHLGDYIYEYSTEGYGGETGARLGRNHQPTHEIVSLADYRMRHAQYKADPASQAMHAAHPLIAIWDDHETSNDSWSGGAENHQTASEGDWNARRRAALQAYYEWMPVREPEHSPEAFFRSFSYGDLLTIAAIESRLMARAKKFEHIDVISTFQTPEDVERFKNEILWDDTREMLGAAQIDYLDRTFRTSVGAGQPWRLLANQIVMARVKAPDLTPHLSEEDIAAIEQQWDRARAFVKTSTFGLPSNFDAWDGYPAARERFYDMVRQSGDDGMIVITGDSHTWWANDLVARDGGHMGVELGVNSVSATSPYGRQFLGGHGANYALLTNRENKDVRYLSGENNGYIDLEITHSGAHAEFVAVDNVASHDYNAFTKAAFNIDKKDTSAKFSDADDLGFKEGI